MKFSSFRMLFFLLLFFLAVFSSYKLCVKWEFRAGCSNFGHATLMFISASIWAGVSGKKRETLLTRMKLSTARSDERRVWSHMESRKTKIPFFNGRAIKACPLELNGRRNFGRWKIKVQKKFFSPYTYYMCTSMYTRK